jgi:hypothetical protein
MCEKRAQRGKHRTEVTEVTEGLEFCGRKFFSGQGGFSARNRLGFFQDLGFSLKSETSNELASLRHPQIRKRHPLSSLFLAQKPPSSPKYLSPPNPNPPP